MINQLLGELYWEGIDREFESICKLCPVVRVTFHTLEIIHFPNYLSFLEEQAMDKFLLNFLYHRTGNMYYETSAFQDVMTEEFETKVFAEKILDNLAILQNKMISMIAARQMQVDYEAGHMYCNDQPLIELSRIKNLEELWKIFIGR